MNDKEETAVGRNTLFFIVNPASHSGKGMSLWKKTEAILKAKNVPYKVYLSEKRGDIAILTRRLTASLKEGEERTLVMLGGDGTVNEGLQGIRNFAQIRLGYIPTGSSNDLARDMGIGGDVESALLAVLDEKREKRIDLGRLIWREDGKRRERLFLVGCGIGYDAEVCEEAFFSPMKAVLNRLGLGKLTYLGIGLKKMVTAPCVRAAVRLDGDRIVHLHKMLFVVSMLHRFEGGGFCFCPQADAQDGILDVCVVDGVPKWKYPIIIPFALLGRHGQFSGVSLCRARRIDIKTSVPLWVQTDGEVPGKMDRITITNEKQKVRFIC